MQVVLLSNSSKRRADALKNLAKMGMGSPGLEGLFLDVITSGEVTHTLVTSGAAGKLFHEAIVPGSRVYVCGSGDGDQLYVTGLGCTLAGPDECDWILARGNFVLVGSDGVPVQVPAGKLSDGFAEQVR